ncbi:large repetitive protein [Salmonella enterica subsp. indica]|uniref:Large repetitive protein n=1 Tax=Salmonella enterica subsp. indica TaxID=59207 RepID=A0A379XVR7_SALER|nr:large repetitive protein [Salmonella enterica subsp. indica]
MAIIITLLHSEDIAGNQSPPITGKITIDSESHLKINGLSNDTDSGAKADNITSNTTPTLTGTAEANATITLTIDGNRYTTTANGDGAWTIPLTYALTDGDYHYTVTATDSAGNTATSTATITIDTTAPDYVTGGLDTTSETGAAGSHLTNQVTPTFSGATESGATVTLMINGKTYTAIAGDNGKWSITLPEEGKLADGSYPYTITVTDASGNTSGAQVNGNVTVQNTPPSANAGLHAGSDSGVMDDQITQNTQPTLSGKTAPDASVVVIYAGVNYPVSVDASGYWTFRVPATLTDGDYAYQVLATDSAGNESRYDGTFTIDTTPPDAPAAALAESADSGVKGDDITYIKNPTFTGTAEANATVILTINGKDYTAKAGSDGVWTITLPVGHSLPDGTYQYTVLAQDAAGNTSAPATGSVTINTTAPAIPVGGLDATTGADNITNITTPTFSGTAEPNITVILTLNGKRYDVPVNKDGIWRFTLPDGDKLNDGAYDFTLQGQNTTGTTSDAFSGSITIDTTPPGAVVGELTTDTDTGITGDNITTVSTPTFTGTTEPDATVILTLNNITYEFQADSSGVWRFTLPTENALSDDTYIYTLQAKDAAGNSSTPTSGSLTIDSTPPVLTDVALTDDSDTGIKGDNITSINTPTFTGSSEANATITLNIDSKVVTTTADSAGKWTITLDQPLNDGVYEYTLTAKDAAGNENTLNEQLTIDTHPPAEPSLGSTANGLDSTVILQGTVEANQDIQVKVTVNGTEYSASVDNDSGDWHVSVPQSAILSGGESVHHNGHRSRR